MVKSYDRYELTHTFGVITTSNLSFLPSGHILTGGLEELLSWDIKTGEIVQKMRDGVAPGAVDASTSTAPSPVTHVCHHDTSGIAAVGYADGSIKIWDMASGSVVITFHGHRSAVSILRFDRSGTRLVSGSADASIIVWDLVGEEGLFKLKGHKGSITGIRLLGKEESEDDSIDEYLLSVSKDGLLKLWDLRTQQCVETHLAHASECWGLGVAASGDMAVTSGNKDQVKVWKVDLETEENKLVEVGTFEKQSKARANEICFSTIRGSSVFYVQNTDKTVEVYRVRGEEEVRKGISRRTKRLQEKGCDEAEIAQNLREAQVSMMVTPFATLRAAAKVRACTWTPKGDIVVALANNSMELYGLRVPENIRKGQAEVVRRYALEMPGHRTDVRCMDMSDDNRLLCTGSNGELKVWNIRTHNVVRTFALDAYALCCRFLPGGTLVAVGFKNGDLALYDLASSAVVDFVEGAHKSSDNNMGVWSMDLTPDGKTLITGGSDKAVRFWALRVESETVPGTSTTTTKLTLKQTQTLEINEDVLCVRVSPCAKYLAVSLLNNNVQVVFLDSLKLFLTLYGHKLPVLAIDISADSKLVLTSSADKNIKIWGLDFGDCHKSIFGHQDSVMDVRFVADSHHFFSAGKDGAVKYWDADKFECIQKLPAHQGEVWRVCPSRDGAMVVSASHDHSLRVWEATEDQVFLEEEREKEIDQMYEDTLLGSLERDETAEPEDGATHVAKQTIESLKAGEKLMEALEIGITDLDEQAQYNLLVANGKNPPKPTRNPILSALGMDGPEYVLSVLSKIKAAQLEDALLALPFSYSLRLLRMVQVWTAANLLAKNTVSLQLICRVLFLVVRTNAKELVAQKDPEIKKQLLDVKKQLRGGLGRAGGELGRNTQGLRFLREQWRLRHEVDVRGGEEKERKRIYSTVA